MQQYVDLSQAVLEHGKMLKIGRTQRLTLMEGALLYFDLQAGFPAITVRRLWWKGVVHELLWFLSGGTNIKPLVDAGVHIWDGNARPDGEVGPAYGYQWRNWNGSGYDQIANSVRMLQSRPKSTRNVVMAWNPLQVGDMALPPCHFSHQVLSDGTGVWLHMSQRSCDVALGLPYNIASYALLTHLYAKVAGLQPMGLTMSLSHVHIYAEHLNAMRTVVGRTPCPPPTLHIDGPVDPSLRGLRFEQFRLENYEHHPDVKMKMIVT